MAGEKYWKISRVVMVITSENIGFITSGEFNWKLLHLYYTCLYFVHTLVLNECSMITYFIFSNTHCKMLNCWKLKLEKILTKMVVNSHD